MKFYLFIYIFTCYFAVNNQAHAQPTKALFSQFDLKVFLEGPFDHSSHSMSTVLRDKGYLPGMRAKVFLASETPAEDPYKKNNLSKRSINVNKVNISADYPTKAVDWVLVELNNPETDELISLTALLLSDGHLDFSQQSEQFVMLDHSASYFVSISHRNHKTISSIKPIKFDGKLVWDATTSQANGAKKIKDGAWVMMAGKLDATNPKVSLEDLNLWKVQIGMNSSYLLSDLDLNGDVNMTDQEILLNNLRADQGY
jgi:hypothetical protein